MSARTFGEITLKESLCLLTYLITGDKVKAAQAAGYYGTNRKQLWQSAERCLKKPLVKETMQIYLEKAEKIINFEWKLLKLKKMINAGAKDIQGDDEQVELRDPRTALDALDMLNKIQGHYAPTKTENTDKSDDETKELLKELIQKHEKPY